MIKVSHSMCGPQRWWHTFWPSTAFQLDVADLDRWKRVYIKFVQASSRSTASLGLITIYIDW